MKDWDKYSSTKAKMNDLSGSKPTVWEYFCIKIVDNGLLVVIVSLTVLFATASVILDLCKQPVASVFSDLTKLGFGVILGMVAEKKRR